MSKDDTRNTEASRHRTLVARELAQSLSIISVDAQVIVFRRRSG